MMHHRSECHHFQAKQDKDVSPLKNIAAEDILWLGVSQA